MGKNRIQFFDGSKFSAWFVLAAANAYYALSATLTATLPRTVEEINAAPPSTLDLAASTTNRVLALELYLKAVIVGANMSGPKVHDLKMLFDSLPQEMRQTFEHHYNERCKIDAGLEVAWHMVMCFQLGDHCDDAALRDSGPTERSLAGLLERNKEGFVVSRYLFQEAKHEEAVRFDYEYKRLSIICSVLCEALENSLPNRPDWYNRSFIF